MTPQASLNRWLEARAANFDAVMLDIDGVLLNNRTRLPGSRRLFDLLGRHAKPLILLTNDGNHSTAEKADRLSAAGLAVTPGQIVSCGHAIKAAVQTRNLTGQLFFVMGDTGTPCYTQAAGLRVTRHIADLRKCKGVVIGEENYDWESVINAVINYFIDHPDAPLIIPNPDEFYPGPRLKIHVAAGGIGRFIQRVLKVYGTDIDPIYLGKPYADIFRMAQKTLESTLGLNMAARRILMIGDNISADIGGASAMGYATALLLTGVTRRETVSSSGIIPDMVFEAL